MSDQSQHTPGTWHNIDRWCAETIVKYAQHLSTCKELLDTGENCDCGLNQIWSDVKMSLEQDG